MIARGAQGLTERDAEPTFGFLAAMPVANRPLLERVVESLSRAGIEQIAVMAESDVREEAAEIVEHIPRHGAEIEICDADPALGLAAAAAMFDGEPFVLHLGDSLCWDLDLVLPDVSLGADDLVVFVQPPRSRARRAAERPRSSDSDGANGSPRDLGVYVVGSDFAAVTASFGRRPTLASQANAAIASVAANGGHTYYCRKPNSWRHQERASSILEANVLALGRLEEISLPDCLTDTDAQGAIHVDPTARVESSVIRGPVSIGPGARVRDAYIGPNTAIGAGAEIEAVEITYSVVFERATIRHLRQRLDASVIGPEARVFSDFQLPRAARLRVGRAAEIALS